MVSDLQTFLSTKLSDFEPCPILIEKSENLGENSLFLQNSVKFIENVNYVKTQTHDFYHEVSLNNEASGFITQIGKEIIFIQSGQNDEKIKEILCVEYQ